jgi:drug/metabolite transporter (DMT)-like permease
LNATSNTEQATPASAIFLVIGAGLVFSVLDLSAKYLVLAGVNAVFVSWMRFLVHLLLVLVMYRSWSDPSLFRAKSLSKQFVRGVFMFASTLFNFLALLTLQLAETMSIFFLAPVVITMLAGPLLGERVGWRRWAAVIVGFVGMLVIVRPGFGAFGIGHVYAVTSMLGYCFYVIMTRSMGATESPASLIFYSALAPVVLMAPAVPFTASSPPDAWHLVILLSLGFYGGFGHWLLIRAYRQATTSALAPYPYLQMVWMIAFGYFFFDQLPDGWTLVGAAIIVSSGLYIIYREQVLRLRRSAAPTSENSELAEKL